MTTTSVYGYDTAGRLTDVTVDGVLTAHYAYDGNGNRLSVTRPGSGTVSGSYDAQDRGTTYGAIAYTYTSNGDLLTATTGSETTTYAYDVFGTLTAVTVPSGTQIAYVIDGQNRRIGKKVNGVLTQAFLYSNQLRPAAELDGSGAIVSRFVYGTRINIPDYMVRGGVTYRLLTDHLGSVRLVVNTASGAIVQRIDYDEFGQVTQDTTPGFQPFGFAGGLYDPDTKLVRFGARDYDAFTGRWTAKDPVGFSGGSPSLYGYTALIDPINLVDPSGLWTPTTTRALLRTAAAAAGVIGAVAAAPALGPAMLVATGALALYGTLEYVKGAHDIAWSLSGECVAPDKGPGEDLLGTFLGPTAGKIGNALDWVASVGNFLGGLKTGRDALAEIAKKGGAISSETAGRLALDGLSALGQAVH